MQKKVETGYFLNNIKNMFKKSWSRGCRKRIRDEAAHVAQVEEAKEPMLMLATAEAEINASSSSTYSSMA